MMKCIQILLLLIVGHTCFGQQQAVFSNFLLNDYYYNPAIAGSKDVHVANFSYRNQWVGFEGAPTTIVGNFYGSLKNKGKVGYGASIISDKTGLVENTGIYINYAQHFKLSKSLKLGIGIRPGYIQYKVKLYDVQIADEGDDLFIGNLLSANSFDVQTGFHLYSDRFFLMGSMQNLLGDQIKFTSYNSNLAKHYNVIGGYNFKLEKKNLEIQPSILLRNTTSIPTQISFMLKGIYQGKYWAGVTYTASNAGGVYLGYELKERLNIGYGFDFPFGGISSYQSGSHEIVVSYVLTKKKPQLDEKDDLLNKSILEEMQEQLQEQLEEEKQLKKKKSIKESDEK